MNPQPIILAVDAACTASQPSGVGLAQRRGDWYSGGEPDIPRLLDAAQRLAGGRQDLVTLGIPVARKPFTATLRKVFEGLTPELPAPTAERSLSGR